MANTKLPARLLDTSAIPALNVTGDLTVDTTTLKVDSTNNRVGVGIASPSARLDVRRGDADGIIAEFHQNTGYGIDIGSSQAVAYISSGYNQRLDFKTDPTSGQTERMSILANGKVGIGTTTPSSQLVVAASNGGNGIETQVTTHATNNQFILAYDRSNSAYLNMELSTLNFGIATNNGTNRFKILANGNVGIGTNSPAAGLQVSKGLTNAGGPAAGASTASACFGNDGSDDNYGLVLGADGNGLGYISAQRTDGTATAYPLVIQHTGGNVGIGQTPGTNNKLVVKGTVVGTAANLAETASLAILSLNYPRGNVNSGIHFGYANANYIQAADDSGANSKQLTLNPFGGNVGIGTATPDYQLDIENSSHAVARLHAGTNSSASLRLQNDAQHFDVNLQTSDKFAIYDHTAGTQPFTIMPTTATLVSETLHQVLSYQ